MTGVPSSLAFFTAGRIASESMARMTRTLAPFEMRLSTSVSCLVGDPWASAEIYLAPCASSAFLIAASSVFQRSSWKFDHETPTVTSFASAAKETTLADASKAAPNISLLRVLIVFLHLRSIRDRRKIIGCGAIAQRHDTIPASNARAIGQESHERIGLQGKLSLITISIR